MAISAWALTQWWYSACKQADGLSSTEGIVEREMLQLRVVCLAAGWPYEPLPVGPTEGRGSPPHNSVEEAGGFWCSGMWKVAGAGVRRVRQLVDEQQPVDFIVKTLTPWDYPPVEDTGKLPMPLTDHVVPLKRVQGGFWRAIPSE